MDECVQVEKKLSKKTKDRHSKARGGIEEEDCAAYVWDG